ncbi:MAG: PAS domain-containing protein [Corynebacterium sp.]|nr:PAS domain-containing protein [Corynebacterium sp.]
MIPQVIPTGAYHEVGVDQLFFSTTDTKGIIELCNDVFVELSRYQRNELIAAPHNIIRHPDMPAGAFAIMWEQLTQGRSFAGYVRNLGKDGSAYEVYALVTPLPDGSGYLSVRQRPSVEELANQAWDLYDGVRELEAENYEAGANRREIADTGRNHLVGQLQAAGFQDFTAYQEAVLPQEVATRLARSGGIPQRSQSQGTWADCLLAIQKVHHTLEQWISEFARLLATTKDLDAAQQHLQATMEHARRTRAMMQEHSHNPAMLFFSFKLGVWVSMRTVMDRQVESMTTLLAELNAQTSHARYMVAVARLQTVVFAQYCAELIDGAETETSVAAVEVLQASMQHHIREVLNAAQERTQVMQHIVAKVDSLNKLLESPQELLRYALEDPAVAGGEHADVVQMVHTIVAETDACSAELAAVATELAQAPALPDAAQVRSALEQLASVIQ